MVLLVYAVNRDYSEIPPADFAGMANPIEIGPPMTEAVKLGKGLFKANCATCHNKNMKDRLTGPPLVNALEEWSEYPKEDLYRWIKNPMKLIDEEHPRALVLWAAWKPTEMTAFPNMTEAEIDAIFEYVEFIAN